MTDFKKKLFDYITGNYIERLILILEYFNGSSIYQQH